MSTAREVGTRLAVATALDKALRERKAEIRGEADALLRDLSEEAGVSALDLFVGRERVGRLTVGKPSVAIGDPEAYGRWAFDSGMGTARVTVETTDPRAISLAMAAEGPNATATLEYVPDPRLREQLAITGDGQVMCRLTGEVGVPGTYAKEPGTRISGCKPAEVGEAMQLSGQQWSVAGLLEGGIDGQGD